MTFEIQNGMVAQYQAGVSMSAKPSGLMAMYQDRQAQSQMHERMMAQCPAAPPKTRTAAEFLKKKSQCQTKVSARV